MPTTVLECIYSIPKYLNLLKSAFFIESSTPSGLVQSIAVVGNRLWRPAELVCELMKTFHNRPALFLNVKMWSGITAESKSREIIHWQVDSHECDIIHVCNLIRS